MTDVEREPGDSELQSLLRRWQVPPAPRALDERVIASYRAENATPRPVRPGAEPVNLWRRLLSYSIPVPVPVAALGLALVAGAAVWMHQRQVSGTPPAGQGREATIEAPLVEETIVPHVEHESPAYFTATTLSGFQPNAEMSVRVIKRTKAEEK